MGDERGSSGTTDYVKSSNPVAGFATSGRRKGEDLMSAEDKDVRVVSAREDTTEEYSFDALAKGLASGTISRRKALKLVGTAILGAGLFAAIPTREAEADQGITQGEHCEGRTPSCSRGCRDAPASCRCVKVRSSAGTNVRCVHPCCSRRACNTHAGCRPGELCMITGCCPQSEDPDKEGVCVTQCPAEPRPDPCRRQRF